MSLAYILSTQKNIPIEAIILSTHNTCFGGQLRKQYSPFLTHLVITWIWICYDSHFFIMEVYKIIGKC